MVVVCKYADYLRELSDKETEDTPEQKQRILQKTKANHQAWNAAELKRRKNMAIKKIELEICYINIDI